MRHSSSGYFFEISKKAVLSFLFLLFISCQVFASTVTWDGGGDSLNWSDPANWDLDSTPESADIVLFNTTSTKHSTIDAEFGGQVASIVMDTGYSGIITQSTDLTISGSFEQLSGIFTSEVSKGFTVEGSFHVVSGEAHNFFRFSGSGIEGDPYLIYDIYGLQALNCFLGMSNNGVYFELANDIDASATSHWNWTGSVFQGFCPIGYFPDTYHYDPAGGATQSNTAFYGNAKVVSNLYIYRPAQPYVGLFGYRNADTVNLGVANANITGGVHTGIFAGWNNGSTVTRCYSSGMVTGTECTGGLVGISNGGEYFMCHSTASVVSSGKYTGGLVGTGGTYYLNCYATGNVTGDDDSQGGLIGWFNGTLNNSYSTGNVTGLSSCYNTGGFVGNNSGNIFDSYSTGNVTVGHNSSSTGGFAGQGFTSVFFNCYSSGIVTAISSGGFLGVDSGGTPSTNTSCYWDSTKNPTLNSASTGSLTGVSGKTTAQMKQRSTYSGWDFGDIASIWTIDEGKSTPQEIWQIYNWTGWSGDGDWTKLENWLVSNVTPEVYPQNDTHKVLINSSGSITVPPDLTLGGLQLGAGYSDTVTLGGNLTLSSSGTREGSLNLFGGTFDAGIYDVIINGNFIKGTSAAFSDDDSTVYFTGSTPSSIEGQTSFKRFVCATPGKVLVFQSGAVNTIEAGGFLTVEGSPFNPITLKASIPGSQWMIDPLSTRDISNCIVYDSSNISEETIVAVSSVGGGNNTGWSFDSYLFETFSNTGGTIEPGGLVISPAGTTRDFAVYADSGYYLYDVKIDGISTTDAFSVPYLLTFENVSSSHTIEAVFYPDSYRIWDGGGTTNNWSDAANWSGDTTPESGASVLFDVTSVKSATIDASFQGTIHNITIEAGYTGTITQSSDLTIEGSFSQSGGHFDSDTSKVFTVGRSFYVTFEAETFKRFSGAGDSEEDPFVIYDVYGLQAMECYMTSYFKLNNDIDASSTSNWNWNSSLSTYEGFYPVGFTTSGDIGDLTNPFEGHFDGNNKTISNLWMDRPTSYYVALFGAAQGASFKDVALENIHVRALIMGGALGGWLQLCTEPIQNCTASGDLTVYNSGAGGLIGVSIFNNVSECASSVNITGLGNQTVIFGGLIGLFDIGTLYNSTSSGYVNAQYSSFAGGLVGMMSVMYEGGGGTIEGCSASGNISCAGYAGGLVGTIGIPIPSEDPGSSEARGTVKNSHSTGNVSGGSYLGGLIGYVLGENGAYVSNCYSSGTVGGQNTYFTGGLIGSNGDINEDVPLYGAAIDNCYSLGNVTGILAVGGFAGISIGSISNGCYSSGAVIIDEGGFATGGFVGANADAIENCYSTGAISGQNSGGFVGINIGVINNCYSSGNVTGSGGDDYIGGFVCQNQGGISSSCSYSNVSGGNAVGGFAASNSDTISDCYAAGSVEGIAYVGGFAAGNYIDDEEYGMLPGTIERCYASGMVTGYSDTGGLVGATVEGSVTTASFYDQETSGQSDTGKGEPRTTAQMKTLSTFTSEGWNMVEIGDYVDEVWYIADGNDYPRLGWQPLSFVWVGAVNENWSTADNWSGKTVPGVVDTAIFNGSSVLNSVIDTDFSGSVYGLRVQSGYTGEITIGRVFTVEGNVSLESGSLLQDGFDMYVGGNWYSSGETESALFDSAGGSVVFDASDDQLVTTGFNGLSEDPKAIFGDFKHSGSGKLMLADSLVVSGNFENTAGTFEALDSIIVLGGDFTNTAYFTMEVRFEWYEEGEDSGYDVVSGLIYFMGPGTVQSISTGGTGEGKIIPFAFIANIFDPTNYPIFSLSDDLETYGITSLATFEANGHTVYTAAQFIDYRSMLYEDGSCDLGGKIHVTSTPVPFREYLESEDDCGMIGLIIAQGISCTVPGKRIFFASITVEAEGYITFEGQGTSEALCVQLLKFPNMGDSQWIIDAAAQSRDVRYVYVKDSNNINEIPITAVNSVNGGNNTGWNFGGRKKRTWTILIY